VVESAVENHRVRKVVVQYYVTDGTIQVIEPKQDNSGIPQGTFLKRHRVEKREGGGYVNATDLQVGSEVDLYGRTYYLTDADEFSRDFMAKEFGIDLNAADGAHSPLSPSLPRHKLGHRLVMLHNRPKIPHPKIALSRTQLTKRCPLPQMRQNKNSR
jgi:hypothetical protein